MRTLAALALVLCLCAPALAAPYGDYDLGKAVVQVDKATGQPQTLDAAYVRRMVVDLYDHAGSYPPRFDNREDMLRARRDAAVLLKVMPVFADNKPKDAELQTVTAMTAAVAHNMDIPSGNDLAHKYFRRLLELNPDDPGGNHMYGVHLAGSGAPEQALPYLKKSQGLGVHASSFSLAVVYLMLGDRKTAENALAHYLELEPGDAGAAKLLKQLRDPKVKFTRKDS